MTVNKMAVWIASPVNRILDIPFLVTALAFGLSTLRLKFPENKNINLAFILFGLLIIISALYVNIAFPDLNRFSLTY
jgi:hypothetical protein